MKKTLYHIGVIAAASLAFVACNKEVEINQPQGEVTHVATITLGKAVDTRTAVVEGETEAYYKWLETDTQYLHVYENGNEGTITDFILSENNTVATLTVSFTGTPEAPYTYTAKYFSQESNAHNPLIIPEQKPKVDNFDPAADILISKEIVSESGRLSNLKFTMGRVVTVNKMTLTGLVSGEKVSKVEFTLDKYMSSYYKGPNDYSSHKTKLTLNFEDNPATVPADGKVPVYFISAPVDAAGIVSVVVTTDQNVYTKTNELDPNPFAGKTITFAIGKMMRFNMAMSGYGEPISEGVEYALVSNQSGLEIGAEYLIVGNGTNGLRAMSIQNTNNRTTVSVSSVNDVIIIDNTIAANVFKLEAAGNHYFITDVTPGNTENMHLMAGSKADANTNYLYSSVANVDCAVWDISIENGIASIICFDTTYKGVMCLNNEIISSYSALGSHKTLSLYKKVVPDTRQDVTISFLNSLYNLSVGTEDYSSFNGQTATSTPEGISGIKYSLTGDAIGTIVESTGVLTLDGSTTGTAIVTASFEGNEEYKPASASYTITVISGNHGENPSDPFTPAEAIDFVNGLSNLPTETEYYISGIVSRIATNGQFGTQYGNASFYISADGTGSDEFEAFRVLYLGNRKWQTGDLLIGVGDEVVVCGRLDIHNGQAETYAVTGDNAYNGYLYSLDKAPYFTANVTSNSIEYTGGNTITLNIGANVSWTASINNGASLKIGDANAAASVSGSTDTAVTVIIPENTAGQTYTISFTTTSQDVSAPVDIQIIQTKQESLLSTQFVAGTEVTEANYGELTYNRPISIQFAKGSGSNYSYYSPIRFYTNNTLTISSPFSNVTIKKVEFTLVSGNTGSMTANTGNYVVSGLVGTWLGQTSELVLTGGTQTRFSDFTIYYSVDGTLPTLSSISIDDEPTKTTYTVGQAFDFAGATVTAHYSDNTSLLDVTSMVTTDGATVVGTAGTGKTVTVSYTEAGVTKTNTFTINVNASTSGSTTVSMNTFSAISGYVDGDTNISYEASKGGASTNPAVNNNQIRIYQNGGLLTITANNNKKISSITIGSAMATTVQTSVDGGNFSSNSYSISANGTYTISDIAASSVVFKCTGTSSSSRLYLNSLSVTYN